MRHLSLLLLMLATLPAAADVYRCMVDGKTVFTDRPCDSQAAPHALQPSTVVAPDNNKGLAKQHDQRLQEQLKARDQADREWLEQHRADKVEAQRLRKALVEDRVISGMTPQQVRRVLGYPEQVRRSTNKGVVTERWTYRNGKSKRHIRFADGVVIRAGGRTR